MNPLTIGYAAKPSYYSEMLQDCADHARLSRREALLLQCYALLNEGFRPSMKYISNVTGIPENKIRTIRLCLERKGLIIIEDRVLYINWDAVRALAIMPKMSKHDAVHGTWNPNGVRVHSDLKYAGTYHGNCDTTHNKCAYREKLTPDERKLLKLMSSLSKAEYDDLMSAFEKVNRIQENIKIKNAS